jgi:hypothetical protein
MMLESYTMRKPVLFKVPRSILPLAAIFIVLVFSISVFTVQGNDEGLYSLRSQYLSSENQDDDPGCDEGSSCSIINAGLFLDTPENQLLSNYVSEKEVGLQVSLPIVSSNLNRAPPLYL